MNFLYPQFLFALIAVLIPIIVHLFNFQRYKKVYFSNVSFLKEVKHATKAKSNLKHLLILLSRILAIIAIVSAFAQPYIPVKNQTAQTKATPSSIFIDNSFSSENRSVDGRIFDLSRELGYQLIDELPNHINHQFLTNNFTGAEQHLFPTTEITKNLQKLSPSSKSQNLASIIKRQTSAFEQTTFNGYIISDFQKSQYVFEDIKVDSNTEYTFIPIEPVLEKNVSIDSIWFQNPIHRINQAEEVHVRVYNHSNTEARQVRTSLVIDDVQKSFSNLNIPANSYVDTFLVFNTKVSGWHTGFVEIEDSPIIFDNTFYFNFHILEEIKVLAITTQSSTNNIKRAFDTEPYFIYSEMSEANVDIDLLTHTDLLILNEITNLSTGLIASITQYVENGGSLVVLPNAEKSGTNLNDLLQALNVSTLGILNQDSTRVNFINLESKTFDGVFNSPKAKINLPQIYRYYAISNLYQDSETVLLRTSNRKSILSKWEKAKGQVYLFSIPLDAESSNFKIHSIFLPTLFQMAFNSSPQFQPYLIIDQEKFVTLKQSNSSSELLYHVVNKELNVDVIPEIYPVNNGLKLGFHDAISVSGNYEVQLKDSLVGYLSFNYNTKESDPVCYTPAELEAIIDSLHLSNFSVMSGNLDEFSEEFKKRETGIELWRWFVFITLLFLAIEIILIRYFKPSVL